MPALIHIDDRGIPTLEIEDAKGEVLSYRVEVVPRGLSLWAVQLDNLSNGESYRVGLEVGGWFRCTCPSWHFRRSEKHPRGCKHASALKHVYAFLQAMKGDGRERSTAPERERVSDAG